MATSQQWALLEDRLSKLGVNLDELKENFILGSGSGGQKVNKTASCVQLIWADIEIKCQLSRSRQTNRFLAREELCRRLQNDQADRQKAKQQEREKKRRQNRQRSPMQKRRMLDDKKKHSLKKQKRGKVSRDD